MTIPDAETVMERLRMALAEAGAPDVRLRHAGTQMNGHPDIRWLVGSAPRALVWQAYSLLPENPPQSCWSCWSTRDATVRTECRDGNCANPQGPARPPRELLRRPA